MKKLLNAVTISFCILLTACTHSDNAAANPAVTEMSETHGNSAEVISSQAVQTTESDLQHSKSIGQSIQTYKVVYCRL